MTIFEINKEIYNLIDEETGEIKDFETFEKLNLDREQKIENTALWIKDLLGDAEKIKAQKEVLAEREKSCRKKAESLEHLIDFALQGQAYKTDKVSVTYSKSTRCIVSDNEEFIKNHPEFVTKTVTEKISLNDVKKALKDGQEISGAELVENQNMQIK